LKKSGAKKIEELSLVDRLVTLIRDSIITGELEPDEHIGIKKIADEYGVSMIPVREALARLLASRLVRVETNRGYFVASKPTELEFRQFVQARELLERSVVDVGFENATPADIKKLRQLNKAMRKIAKNGAGSKMAEWGNLNAEFHQVLVGLARNTYLSDLYSDLSFGSIHFHMVRSYPMEIASLDSLVDQHDELIDVLEKRDKVTLLRLLSNHITKLTRAR
jgi:DNA-binding GntR family transcriptional regulator